MSKIGKLSSLVCQAWTSIGPANPSGKGSALFACSWKASLALQNQNNAGLDRSMFKKAHSATSDNVQALDDKVRAKHRSAAVHTEGGDLGLNVAASLLLHENLEHATAQLRRLTIGGVKITIVQKCR